MDHWTALCGLLGRFASVVDQPTFLDDCLDTLVDALGADRGLVLRYWPDGGSFAVNARGPGRALSDTERDEVSQTVVEQARHADGVMVWELDLHSPMSMQQHGVLQVLAAPLRAGGQEAPIGVLYLDFRRIQALPDARDRELLTAAVGLLGPVLAQHDDLLRARMALRDATVEREVEAPPLEELLALPGLHDVRQDVMAFIGADAPLLIEGESGTGKTLFAHAIAEAAGRRPIVRATLGLSDDLNTITSELFGHERGAFSGAVDRRVGLVEHANGGTLILDEVLNLSLQAQQLLLDFTQFGTYRPLGYAAASPKRADLRLIAATNGDLRAAVAAGRFREDLYFRLAGGAITVPPLRERRGDVPILAERYLHRVAGPAWRLSPRFRTLLRWDQLPWRGNVRQLEHVIQRASSRARLRGDGQLTLADVRPDELGVATFPERWEEASQLSSPSTAPASPVEALARLEEERVALETRERELLEHVLQAHAGVVAHAAKALGVPRTSLAGRLRKLGLKA
ncbi:MAG: sigma 54-interacting transcriptional regulator [Polyangiaceae bacterium]